MTRPARGAEAVDAASAAPDTERIAALCRSVLSVNWHSGYHGGIRYGYTAPSRGRYPWQWYWDSCFAAIVWRRFDRERARLELETLLSAATPDGFIGHTIFWGRPVNGARRFFYNVRSPSDFTTQTIQPPMLAWAWRAAVGDPTAVPAIERHHDWVERDRDLDGDGLIWIFQPDESGLDASPTFDPIWRWRSDGRAGFPFLVRANRRAGFDIRRIVAAGGPVVCGTATNVLHGLSRLALGRESITPRLIDRLYDERSGRFRPEVRPAPDSPVPATWASLSPLALVDLPDAIGRRLVEEHLLDPDRFWLPVPPPSVAADERSFSLSDRFLMLRRYWRGPTWINAAWLVWLGLVRLGYLDEAGEMARRLAGAVTASGLREYYDPYTGQGMGARDFSWSSLILELLDPDPASARSHLPT